MPLNGSLNEPSVIVFCVLLASAGALGWLVGAGGAHAEKASAGSSSKVRRRGRGDTQRFLCALDPNILAGIGRRRRSRRACQRPGGGLAMGVIDADTHIDE